jgi:phosphatidylinositol glycan class T
MTYAFSEELMASPERVLSSGAVDWSVAWHGRHEVSGLGAGELSPLPTAGSRLLSDFGLVSLRVNAFNEPLSYLDSSAQLPTPANYSLESISSSAGLSIDATFVLPNRVVEATSAAEKDLKDRFHQVLLRVLANRWILGSVESVRHERLHRFLHVDWQNLLQQDVADTVKGSVSIVPVQLMLPHEAFSLSAEGIREFIHRLLPCQGQSGIMSLKSPTEWSNLLLGHEEPAPTNRIASSSSFTKDQSLSIPGRRGIWFDLSTNGNPDCHAAEASPCAYHLDIGMLWRLRTRELKTSWSQLVGQPDSSAVQLLSCPFTDSTRFRILARPSIQVRDTCGDFATEAVKESSSHSTSSLQERCIQIEAPSSKKVLASSSKSFEVEATIWRSQGPGYTGRLETAVWNRHGSECTARVQIWQIVPPVLQPVWTSFQSTDMLPRRRWLDDGTLELTLEANLTADSVLRYGFDYEPRFLSIESFPADPNRGFELPPVRTKFELICPDGVEHGLPSSFSLFSQSLLFLSPLPDASMPFNVLSFGCTFFAFVVGSILNLIVRRASENIKYTLHPELRPKSKANLLKKRIAAKAKAFRSKIFGSKGSVEEAKEKKKLE